MIGGGGGGGRGGAVLAAEDIFTATTICLTDSVLPIGRLLQTARWCQRPNLTRPPPVENKRRIFNNNASMTVIRIH